MHSYYSDGTDSPSELLSVIKKSGIRVFALTDHDTFEGCLKMSDLLKNEKDIYFIRGIEFSCKDEKGKYHILGYQFDPDATSMWETVQKARTYRMNKVRGRLQFLEEQFGFVFLEEEKQQLLSMPNPGKPHIGNLMVQKGYAPTRTEAIEHYINQFHEKNNYLLPEEAITAIVDGGGMPVLAHPLFGDGGQDLTVDDVEKRLERFEPLGLAGIEAYYSGHSPAQTKSLLNLAGRRDLLVTAGSDYHGTNKKILPGQTGFVMDQL